MEIKEFKKGEFARSKTLGSKVDKYSAGQVAIIGGSRLFHGAPLLALKAASRMVSMTYFSSPKADRGVAEKIKAGLASFVWVDLEDVEAYIAKSDAVLIGPGLMRSHVREQRFVCDREGEETRLLSLDLFSKFPHKKWVVDGGTLQVVAIADIPKGAVITPNKKEFEMLFGEAVKEDIEDRLVQVTELAKKYGLTILTKDTVAVASDGKETWVVKGGNEGLVKGGVGDVIAGVVLGFLAKDEPLFAACAATYLVKKTAERLAEERGWMFNADDLVEGVPVTYKETVSGL